MDSSNSTDRDVIVCRTVEQALQTAKERLGQFAIEPEFMAKMQLAFGTTFDLAAADALGQSWLNGDYTIIPPIEIRAAAEINGMEPMAAMQGRRTLYIYSARIPRSRSPLDNYSRQRRLRLLGNDYSLNSAISADGRYIAFHSDASNLVPVNTNGLGEIFVRACQTGETTRLSVASDGTQGNDYSV
jgi:hypothetical protein